ncbi:MAG: hypothetical protein JNL52_06200 [Flavobacteriales bacterium]|nr:hypothetical protein [Flavobacteriales bacterium]
MVLSRAFLLLMVLGLLSRAVAQQNNDVPLQRDFYIDVERNAAKVGARIHSGLKPVLERRADLEHVMGYRVDSAKYYYWITEKIFSDNLFHIREGDVHITIDPLFQFEGGFDPGDRTAYSDTNRYYFNTRGVMVRGDIGTKLSFQTMIHESQALVPQYLFLSTLSTGALSGQGRAKFEQVRRLDIGWSQANISVSPVDWLNIQFGHGKHFVGHGYRSMLLSDHAPNAPYLKFSALTRNKRLQYSTWHTKMTSGLGINDRLPTGSSSENLFYWYRARFNHLSVDLGRLQIGLFESTQFATIDSNGVKPFDMLELNPVIGVNSLLGLASTDARTMLGADLRFKVLDKAYLYGQLAHDGRVAWQAGLRAFDVLRKDLHVQLEYNTAEPFMYMHDPARIAYEHAGMPLAHPLGTSFQEAVAIVDVGILERLWFQAKVNIANFQFDSLATDNHGTSLLKPDVEVINAREAGTRTLTYLDLNASYLFNPHTNLRFVVGVWRRDLPGAVDNVQSTYIYAAIRTSVFNRYYDL